MHELECAAADAGILSKSGWVQYNNMPKAFTDAHRVWGPVDAPEDLQRLEAAFETVRFLGGVFGFFFQRRRGGDGNRRSTPTPPAPPPHTTLPTTTTNKHHRPSPSPPPARPPCSPSTPPPCTSARTRTLTF
jgi:hypothetical protein